MGYQTPSPGRTQQTSRALFGREPFASFSQPPPGPSCCCEWPGLAFKLRTSLVKQPARRRRQSVKAARVRVGQEAELGWGLRESERRDPPSEPPAHHSDTALAKGRSPFEKAGRTRARIFF